MTLSAQSLLGVVIPDALQTVSARDAILYALSVGYGSDPLDGDELRRVYEHSLVPSSTLPNVVAHPGPWMKDAGVNWARVVHSEHRLTIHRPLPLDERLVSRSRMLSIVDRGFEKGMFATFERVISLAEDGEPIAKIIQTNACRGDGGCGSAGIAPEPLAPVPSRQPDLTFSLAVPENAALLYRLNGDLNPLHADPAAADRAGFPRPILHGLCTFGYAGYAIEAALASEGLAELGSIAARFSAPVFPGEAIDFQIWRDGLDVRFRGIAATRGVTVLDNGLARLT